MRKTAVWWLALDATDWASLELFDILRSSVVLEKALTCGIISCTCASNKGRFRYAPFIPAWVENLMGFDRAYERGA